MFGWDVELFNRCKEPQFFAGASLTLRILWCACEVPTSNTISRFRIWWKPHGVGLYLRMWAVRLRSRNITRAYVLRRGLRSRFLPLTRLSAPGYLHATHGVDSDLYYRSFQNISPQLCVPAALDGVQAALERLQHGVPPRPLNYRLAL